MQLHVLHAPHGIEGVAQEWRVVLDGDPSLEGTVQLANEVLRSCRTANPQAQIIAINEVALHSSIQR